MGIAGAALATVTGQIVSALLVAGYMLRFKTGKLERAHFAVTSQKITQIISIGAAGSLNQAAMFVMNLVLNSSLSHYGALSPYGGSEALAAAGVVTKVNFLFYSTIVGCSIGGQPIMGFNFGAGKYDRVKQTSLLMFPRLMRFEFRLPTSTLSKTLQTLMGHGRSLRRTTGLPAPCSTGQ